MITVPLVLLHLPPKSLFLEALHGTKAVSMHLSKKISLIEGPYQIVVVSHGAVHAHLKIVLPWHVRIDMGLPSAVYRRCLPLEWRRRVGIVNGWPLPFLHLDNSG
jgi:hypothetical protein